MKGDAHPPGSLHQSVHGSHVDAPVALQGSEHHAVRAFLAGRMDIRDHRLKFFRRIAEVAAARTDDDMQTGMGQQTAGQPHLS